MAALNPGARILFFVRRVFCSLLCVFIILRALFYKFNCFNVFQLSAQHVRRNGERTI